MKHLIICIATFAVSAQGLQFSSRIKGLGTDFAWLIPDYQTDLYRNPQIFNEKMYAIGYDQDESTPLSIMFCSPRMGILARYWFEYDYELESSYPGWQSTEYYSIHFNDLWMVRIKDEVWNFYNDGYIDRYELDYSDTYYNHLLKDFEYFIGTQTSFYIGKVNVDLKISAGFYEKIEQYNLIDNYNQRIGIASARIGLYYTGLSQPNRFTSWYLSFGGPVSRAEVSSLPYSVYSDLAYHERKLKYFAHTFIARAGWAKAWPLANKSFIAIGLCDDFVYQPTHSYSTDNDLEAITNRVRIPLAVEYLIKKIYLRFGTSLIYDFARMRETNAAAIFQEDINHEFRFQYSFGLGWQLTKNLSVDLYNQKYLYVLSNWSISIKYVF